MNVLKYSLMALFIGGALAVSGQDNAGAAQFPELTPDVRGVGMGNTGVGSGVNAFSLYRNAAKGVFSSKKGEIGYAFTPWMRELKKGSNLHGVAGYYLLDEQQGVHVGFRHFTTGEVDLEGEKTFQPKNMSVDVGYSRKLTEELSVGATARFVRSDMSGADKDAVANTAAFDLGFYYQRAYGSEGRNHWSVGLQASNFGLKVDYGYGKYDQPAKVMLGGGVNHRFSENHALQVAVDAGCRVLPSACWEGGAGVEYKALGMLSVRGGYHWGETDNKMQRYGTLGVGVDWRYFCADAAYVISEHKSFMKNTWQAGVALNLGEFFK